MSVLRSSSAVGDRIKDGADAVERIDGLSRRVRADYDQMPGLSLTARQAARLWNVTPDVSQRVLSSLVAAGYLRKGASGYVRTSSDSTALVRGN